MTPVINNEENMKKCVCAKCPSYNECSAGKNELLFCAIGKSGCEYKMNGCICGSCPVEIENGLKAGYYCLKGSAEEMSK
jgi:hypothetical protein